MSRSVNNIRDTMDKNYIGDYVGGSTTSNGTAGGTTLVTTAADVLQRQAEDFVPGVAEVLSGACSGESRPIASVAVSSGIATFTVSNAFSAQIVSGVTFRIHLFPVAWKMDAIAEAMATSQDIMPRVIQEELLAGNLLRNANLELWQGPVPATATSVTVTVQGPHPAVFVIAASNASANSKLGADYVCDGTADNVEINEAIGLMP